MCRSITTKLTLQGKLLSPSQSRKAQTLKFFCNLIFQRCKEERLVERVEQRVRKRRRIGQLKL